jgi:starch phosphorylase
LIRGIVQLTRDERFRRRIVFIEDYDMIVARYMVQGADLWLNNPLRFYEASGTSGMKAAANGVLNISTLDGWWDEAYLPEIGWAIGRGEVYTDSVYQDEVESNALYDLLENEVVPLFYERGPDGLPRKWIARIKAAMKAICPYFNTARMVMEYTRRFYLPGTARYIRLTKDGIARARALAAWKERLYRCWPEVRVLSVDAEIPSDVQVGTEIGVCARIHLGELTPGDVRVELYHGPLDSKGEIDTAMVTMMECTDKSEKGDYLFTGKLICHTSGRYGYNLRVMPYHEDIGDPYRMGLVRWA